MAESSPFVFFLEIGENPRKQKEEIEDEKDLSQSQNR